MIYHILMLIQQNQICFIFVDKFNVSCRCSQLHFVVGFNFRSFFITRAWVNVNPNLPNFGLEFCQICRTIRIHCRVRGLSTSYVLSPRVRYVTVGEKLFLVACCELSIQLSFLQRWVESSLIYVHGTIWHLAVVTGTRGKKEDEGEGEGKGKGPNLCRQYFYLSAFGPVGRLAPGALISGCRHCTCAPISCQDRGPWSSPLPLLLHRRIFIRRIWSLHVTPLPFQRTPSTTSSHRSLLLSGNIPGTCAVSRIKTVSLPLVILEIKMDKQ